MKVLVVENEKPAADRLLRLLAKIDQTISVLSVLETVEETINWLEQNTHPDFILLDVQLDDGLCFEIFETININIPIIFTTAYDSYTLKAFKVNSIDYLLKPINEGELSLAINKFRNLHLDTEGFTNPLKKTFENFKKQYRTRFLIKIGSKFRPVATRDINYAYISDKSTFLKLNSGREYAIDYSLDKLYPMLDPDNFYRLNRNCIIHISAIRDMLSYSSSRLQLVIENESNNELFVVSRDRVSNFKRWIDR